MSDYNLGTASGRIVVDGSGARVGFNVAQTAAGAFFGIVEQKVNSIQTLGRRMTAVGAAGVAGFGLSVKAASAFETQMSGVFAVANATDEQMDALRQTALRIGKDTQYSASEAAAALEEIIKAGISTEDAVNGAADATVSLAAAGGLAIPQAAEIAANAMNAFSIKAQDMSKVADIFAGVANTSAADVSELGQSLSQASAVANLAGLSFRDTVIALGEFADRGIKGSDAGTSLKTMLNNLIPTTEKQTNKFEELGLLTIRTDKALQLLRKNGVEPASKSFKDQLAAAEKVVVATGQYQKGTYKAKVAALSFLQSGGALNNQFFDQQGNLKSLREIQDVLSKSMSNLTKEQKLQTLETLFGSDAMRASAILTEQGAKGYDDFSAAVSKTKASDVAKVRMNNLSGAVEQFKGSLETAQIILGSVFLPALTKLFQLGQKALDFFIGLPAPIQKAIAIVGLLASTSLLLVGAFLALLPVIASMVVNFIAMKIISTITKTLFVFIRTLFATRSASLAAAAGTRVFTGAASTGAARVGLLTKAIKLLRLAFVVMTGPIGIVIAVVAALAAIGVYLYKNYKPFRDLVNQIGAAIKDKFQAAVAALRPVLAAVLAALVRFGGFVRSSILPVLIQVGKQILGKLIQAFFKIKAAVDSDLMPALRNLSEVFTGTIVPAAKGLAEKIQPLINKIIELAMVAIPPLIRFLGKLGGIFIKYILPILIRVAAFFAGVLIDAIVDFVDGCIKVVSGVINVFSGLINFFKGLFTGNWSQVWKGIKQIFTGVIQLIVGAFKIFMSIGLFKAASLGFRGLLAVFKLGWRGLLALFRGAGQGLWAIARGLFNFLVGIVKGSFGRFVGVIRSGIGAGRAIFAAGKNFIMRIVSSLAKGIVTLIKGGIGNFRANVSRGFSIVVSIVKAALRTFVGAVRAGISNAVSFVRGLPGKIVGALKGIGSRLYSLGSDLMHGFINGVKSMASSIISAVLRPIEEAKNKVKSLLRIGSPSKLFRDYGAWTFEGAELGVKDTGPDFVDSAVTMAQAMIGGFSRVMEGFDPALVAALDSASVPLDAAAMVGAGFSAAPARTPQQNGQLASRLVSGELEWKNGKAYIRGIAQDVVSDDNDFKEEKSRRSGGLVR